MVIGEYFKYPSKINNKFFWNIYLENNGNVKFEQTFKENIYRSTYKTKCQKFQRKY